MKLSIKGLAIASAIIWGGAVLLMGIANLIWPTYGTGFLEMVASVYPGYSVGTGLGSVVIGTIYGLIDGAICGGLFGWIYNIFAE